MVLQLVICCRHLLFINRKDCSKNGAQTDHLTLASVVPRGQFFDEYKEPHVIDESFDDFSGWMNEDLFFQWFEQMFIVQTKNQPRPLLLILDGYHAHFKVETLKLAVENQMYVS